MIVRSSGHRHHRRTCPLGVLVLALFVLLGGWATSVVVASSASSLARPATDPVDTTAPQPTQPATTPPTAPDSTSASTQPPATTAPPATGSSGSDGSYGSGSQYGRQPQGAAASTNSDAGSRSDAATADTTVPPMTTTQDLLVGSVSTPAPTTTLVTRNLTGSSVTQSGGSSDPKIWVVVGALVLVALLLAVATVFYWRRTRPVGGGDHGGSDGQGRSHRRRSRYSDLVVTSPEPQ